MLHFSCPDCRAPLKAPVEKAERLFRCPRCGATVRAPRSPGQPPTLETAELDNSPEPPAAPDVFAMVPEPEDARETRRNVPILHDPRETHVPAPAAARVPDLYPDWEHADSRGKTRTLLLTLAVVGSVALVLMGCLAYLAISYSREEKQARTTRPEQPRGLPRRVEPVHAGPRPVDQFLPPQPPPRDDFRAPNEEVELPERPRRPSPSPRLEDLPEWPPVPAEPKPPKPAAPIAPPAPTDPTPPPEEKPDATTAEKVQRLIQQLRGRNAVNRATAADGLGALGPKAKEASRALCEAMLDPIPAVGIRANLALEKVNPTLQALVLPLIVDRDGRVRNDSLQKLQRLGFEAKPAVPILLQARSHVASGEVLVTTLAAVAPDDPQVTAAFLLWLRQDDSPEVRVAVAKFLPRMEGGKQAVPTLALVLQTDRQATVRAAAATALGEFGEDAKAAVPALTVAKTDPATPVREAAERALLRVGKP